MAEISTSSRRVGGEMEASDVAVGTHLHRDYWKNDSTSSSVGSVGIRIVQGQSTADDDRINLTFGGGEPAYISQQSTISGESGEKCTARPTKTKKEREEYDPELERLVRERVQDLNVQVQSEHTFMANSRSANEYINGSMFAGDPAQEEPCRLKETTDSQIAPVVPPRKKELSRDVEAGSVDTLDNHVISTSSLGLGSSATTTVCQQPTSQFVNDGHHDYINQDHLDSILEEQEVAVEVRAKVGNGRNKDPQDCDGSDDESESDMTLEQKQAFIMSNASLSSLHNLEPLKSSSGHKSEGPETRASVIEVRQLGEFERRLLLAKQKGRAPMPSVMGIPWYHPGITRHIAECLLLSREIKDGTYLMRQSGDTLAISVRCQSSTRHYRIVWDGKQFTFGLGKFSTVEQLQAHFSNQPIISGDSGIVVQLCNPYPRAVSEPAVYEDANVVTTGLTDEEVEQLKEKLEPKSSSAAPKKRLSSNPTPALSDGSGSPAVGGGAGGGAGGRASASSSVSSASGCQHQPYLSINSKEGYLTKLGFHRKNWKRRWFVLLRNELKYFNNKDDKEPIKAINLYDATSVTRDDSCGKSHCFRLVTGYRTFYMYAVSDTQANEWVQILQWKLSSLHKQSPPKY